MIILKTTLGVIGLKISNFMNTNNTSTIEFLRSFRVGGYAVFDFVASFLTAYLVAPFLSKLFLKIGVSIPERNWLFLIIPIGVIFHLAFGQMTPMTRGFLDPRGHYLIKIVIFGLLVAGLAGIKMVKM